MSLLPNSTPIVWLEPFLTWEESKTAREKEEKKTKTGQSIHFATTTTDGAHHEEQKRKIKRLIDEKKES